MKKNIITIIVVALLMFLSFMTGRSLKDKEIVTKVNAEPVIESNMMNLSSGVSYEKVYAYGHTFIVFSNCTGEMEVFCIQ